MEAQEIRSSETRLDVAVLPDVPFLRVLNYLSGLQIEKCRGISRLFQQRIDVNRKSLPTVQVYSLTIDQKKVNPEPLTNNHNEVEPTIFIAIEKDWSRMKYGAAPLRQALERFNHMFPGMSIKTLHLKLEYFDVATFHQLLKKLEECKVKCQNLLVATEGQKFDWKELRLMLLQLEPENFELAILGETTLLTSSFWQDKCIRDRRGLAISARNLSFDDQVLLNFASPNFMLSYLTACTFAGIASFLNEWGAGIREVTKIRLRVRSDLNIREFFAQLSWNVKFETKVDSDCFDFLNNFIVVRNSLGKKLHLWIEQEEAMEFCFEMLEDYDNDYLGYSWAPIDGCDYEQELSRLRLRKAVSSLPNTRFRKFRDEEILETWPIKELLS